MTKESMLHLVLALMLFLLPVVLGLLPGNILIYVAMFIPVLFFSILTGILTNFFYGFLVGALVPLVVWALRGEPDFLPEILPVMCASAAAGLMSGICYRKFLFPFGVSFASLILSIIVYGIVKPAVCLMLKMSYKFTDFLDEVAVRVWPGLLLCIILLPLLCAFLRKTGALQALHRDLDYSR